MYQKFSIPLQKYIRLLHRALHILLSLCTVYWFLKEKKSKWAGSVADVNQLLPPSVNGATSVGTSLRCGPASLVPWGYESLLLCGAACSCLIPFPHLPEGCRAALLAMLPAAGGEESVMFSYLLHVFPIVNHSEGCDPLLIRSHVLWGSHFPLCSSVHIRIKYW